MSLTFKESTHRYTLDGKHVSGVTTLLDKGLPKPQLVAWAAKTVAQYVADNQEMVSKLWESGREPMVQFLKSIPNQKRDTAAIRGTEIHNYAERIVHGETVEVPEALATAVAGYVKWLDKWNPEVIWTERPVANRKWWFAGKPDIVCKIDGETWLLDWKSASGVYGSNGLQIACYGNAEFYVDEQGEEQPMPNIDRYGIVHIQPESTELYELLDPESAWKDALHVIWTANAKDRIDGYLVPLTKSEVEK